MEVINRENQKEYIEEINKIILNKNPKYIILTMGCQLNENDSEKLSGMIEKMGYTNIENIYACGDCIEETNVITHRQVWLPLGTNANKEGRCAAVNLALFRNDS